MNNKQITLNPNQPYTSKQPELETERHKFQPYNFSKNWTRTELARGFNEKGPACLVAALNVTKIASAIFIIIEKFAAKLEYFLNKGVFLLNRAYKMLLDNHNIFILDIHKKPQTQKMGKENLTSPVLPTLSTTVMKIPEITIYENTKDVHPNTIPISKDDTIFSEEQSTPNASASEINPLDEKPSLSNKAIDPLQHAHAKDTDDPLNAYNETETAYRGLEGIVNLDFAKESKIDLNSQDLAERGIDMDLDEPSLLPAPTSNKTRNLFIGVSITAAALITTYVACCHFTNLIPNSLNFFRKTDDLNTCLTDKDLLEGKFGKDDLTAEEKARRYKLLLNQAYSEDTGVCYINDQCLAPSYLNRLSETIVDLCHTDSPVNNICIGNLGVERSKMPQVNSTTLKLFLQKKAEQGVRFQEQIVNPNDLIPVQSEMNLANVANMINSYKKGSWDPCKERILSAGGYVLDGHHRWAACSFLDRAMTILNIQDTAQNVLSELANFDGVFSIGLTQRT